MLISDKPSKRIASSQLKLYLDAHSDTTRIDNSDATLAIILDNFEDTNIDALKIDTLDTDILLTLLWVLLYFTLLFIPFLLLLISISIFFYLLLKTHTLKNYNSIPPLKRWSQTLEDFI